jgi:T4-like virus tail tube protein gp19
VIVSPSPDPAAAPATHYAVSVEATGTFDLGSWTTVDGLDRLTRGARRRPRAATITLTRAATATATSATKHWLDALSSGPGRPATMTIALVATDGAPVGAWSLHDVLPTNWSISGFDTSASKVALETLTVAAR